MSKVLIVNRGEIARRIIKSAKKLSLFTVVVFSDADRFSPYVREADQAYYIGGTETKDSYLNIDKILAVIKELEITMVHPGYGFLSENADFVSKLENMGVNFVGPSSDAIKKMANKLDAKKIAKSVGVDIIIGSEKPIEDLDEVKKISREIGFPVMVKASAGGGGRGMRIIHEESQLEHAIQAAQSEAMNFFGDKQLFIEKYISSPKHIEIQIMADKFGNVVCLGERECSIQRNNQKVIEEAPSVFVTKELRESLYKQSVLLAKAVKYFSLGTVEFVVDKDRKPYFLEMNTRLQVEHPVTEMIVGEDLVSWMFKIAMGEKISFVQSDVKLQGHSIEARLYAENVFSNFSPSTGCITHYKEPENARVDSGVEEGTVVSTFYDPMLAKLIVDGKNRSDAIKKMQLVLDEFEICGLKNNLSFLSAILHHPNFIDGSYTTDFIKQNYKNNFSRKEFPVDLVNNINLAAILVHFAEENKYLSENIFNSGTSYSNYCVIYNGDKVYFDIKLISNQDYHYEIEVNLNQVTYKIQANWNSFSGYLAISINNQRYKFHINLGAAGAIEICYREYIAELCVREKYVSELEDVLPKVSGDNNEMDNVELLSPIAGKVVLIAIKENDLVQKKDLLLVIEAMKMENSIISVRAGKIKKIAVEIGSFVTLNQLLIEFND